MGAVYLARDMQAFGRPCVIKEMLDYYDRDNPQARAKAEARFTEEGRTLASLSHPGIPKIYAFFKEDGRYFIVMEYILGENLEEYVTHEDAVGRRVARKPISEEDILRYAIQSCGILEYLADQPRPVIHQDVKPANLIRERIVGDVRLVDFGTAWARRRTSPSSPGSQLSSVYGTMGYAAPEQCRGAPVPRSDVYSLAATIYHLLTDDDPRDHPGRFPELGSLRPDLRSALEQSLRPDPTDRSTARRLREHLEAILTPQRVLGTFAFPGGDRIGSVNAIPAICDRHWRAACDYLYNGDFERWLRDLNRLDLVELAKSMRGRYRDRDAGLEAFLRRLDPGLARPAVAVAPAHIDAGRVARGGEITHQLSLRNATRGYVRAKLTVSEDWLQVEPRSVGLLADDSSTPVSVSVHTGGLSLRGRHRGVVAVNAGVAGHVSIPVTVQVSVVRELWRDAQRAWRGALPAAVAAFQARRRWLWHLARRLVRLVKRRPRLFLYGYPLAVVAACVARWQISHSKDVVGYVQIGLGGPLILFVSLALIFAVLSLVVHTAAGALKGMWQVFRK